MGSGRAGVIQLHPEERGLVTRYLQSLCGVSLDASKDYLIEGRLGGLAGEAGCSTFSQFVARAQDDRSGALPRRIVDAITTGETLFFRDTAPFDLLRHKILPELIDRNKRGANSCRIWSAACSTGQELYSIAIALKELLGEPDRHGVRLLGTDISDAAIARASRGWYGAVEMSRGLPPNLQSRYFSPHADGWQIRDEIRALVSFQKVNLLRDFSALGRFDVIFCRNVAIYFSNEDRKSLFSRMERALEPGGALIIGAMESLNGICPQFESKRHMRAIYYQLKT
jgi:chemotaxis protein methyltransferase CheR